MELNDKQTEFIELLDDASTRVNDFVEKIMAPMVEAYGTNCLAPSKLPLDYILDVARLYLRLESVRQCKACREALNVDGDGPVRAATEKASRILTLAALQFCRHESGDEGIWLPGDLHQTMASAQDGKPAHDAGQVFQEVIHEAASRYLMRTVYEAAVRLTELQYEQPKAFPKPLLGRGNGGLAYAPLPYSDELQQQFSVARDIVSAYFAAQAQAAIESGGGGASKAGLARHYH